MMRFKRDFQPRSPIWSLQTLIGRDKGKGETENSSTSTKPSDSKDVCGSSLNKLNRTRFLSARAVLAILIGVLVFAGNVFNATPVKLALALESATVLNELILYDDAYQSGFAGSSWGNIKPDPNYSSNVFNGTYSLRKNLTINGGSGDLMTIYRDAGFNVDDYTHVDFYATSLSLEGANVLLRLATKSWEGSSANVPLDISHGTWTHYQIAFDDFGDTIAGSQFGGLAFSGGGPNALFSDSDNDVVFDDIKIVKLPDEISPELVSTYAISSDTVRAEFSEPIDSVSAASLANYGVSSSTDATFGVLGRTPIDAELLPNGRDILLSFAEDLSDGHSYDLTVNGVADVSGNAIAGDSSESFVFDEINVTLSVDAGSPVRPFNPMMRGSQLACWMHEQVNKTGPNDTANLWELVAPLDPSIVRYCGGLWANGTGWDRYGQAPNNGSWQFTDPNTNVTNSFEYLHSYKPEWIDNLATFLNRIDSKIMLQANICDDNPEMWADLVRYANVEKGYNFKYWELGNEIDLSHGDDLRLKCFGNTDKDFAAHEYAKRFVEYTQAMKTVDPSIKIMGPVPANYYSAPTWFPLLVQEMSEAGLTLDVMSWHWYQLFEWDEDPTTKEYDFGSVEALLNYNTALTDLNEPYLQGDVIDDPAHWLYRGRRAFAGYTPQNARTFTEAAFPDIEFAITELNTNGSDYNQPTNGNHIGALWMADVLGRAAYSGQDINIWYQLYDTDQTKYGMIYPGDQTNEANPTYLSIRPTYYSMLMYSQWFGDTLVESSTSDTLQNVVTWASTDSFDSDKLYLMMVNFNEMESNTSIDISGFGAVGGEYFEMTSTDPMSMHPDLTRVSGETTINGFTIDTSAGNVQSSINAIVPKQVTGINGSTVSHVLPGYSVTAMVLTRSATADTTAPVIFNTVPDGMLSSDTKSTELKVDTNESAICRYDSNPNKTYSTMLNAFASTGSTSHTSVVTGLEDGSTYTYYVRCEDLVGNANMTDTEITFSINSYSLNLTPHVWPEKVDLSLGESYTYTLRNGTQRTLKLVSCERVIPRHKIEVTVDVTGDGVTKRHTLEVALGAVPVSINGLRVYGYAWKEANDFLFEQAWPSGQFPLTEGKAVGFALSDAAFGMFPDIDSYTYPVDAAFHEGNNIQTFLEPKDTDEASEAHAGYDIKVPNTVDLLAIRDGYVWAKPYTADQGGVWLTTTDDENSSPETWAWSHVKNGELLPGLISGGFVTKGTPLARRCTSCSPHFHMASRDSFDFGSFQFTSEIWNNEHANDFPAPRYWLTLGSYDGDMSTNRISANEIGDIGDTVTPRKGSSDMDGVEQWRFGDNHVNSVVMVNELFSEAPFSGYDVDRNPTNAVGYSAVYVFSPDDHVTDGLVHLNWGASYGAKVWLNGISVLDNSDSVAGHRYDTYDIQTERTLVLDETDVVLPLRKGWNTLIIKTNHGNRSGTAWRFSPKIGDANGNKIPSLIFSTRDINLSAAAVGDNSIGISWSAPDYTGTFVETYLVDVATDAGFNNIVKSNIDAGKVTSYNVSGLGSAQQYFVRVKPYSYSEMGGSVLWQHADSISVATIGTENVPFSLDPPGGLAPNEVPMFVNIVTDDNNFNNSIQWFQDLFTGRTNPAGTGNTATFDGTPTLGVLNVIGTNEASGQEYADILVGLYEDGHEIGNHTHAKATIPDDIVLWEDYVQKTNDFFTRPVEGDGTRAPVNYECTPNQTEDCMVDATGLGLSLDEIYGLRAPSDGYSESMLLAMEQFFSFTYMSNTETDHPSMLGASWPGTLDEGLPEWYLADSGKTPIAPHPGIWELPQSYFNVKRPDLIDPAIIADLDGDLSGTGICDSDWFFNFQHYGVDREAHLLALLKAKLDERIKLNRAPLQLCIHADNWGLFDWQSPEDQATQLRKQQMLDDFIEYGINHPSGAVRFVTQIDLINWMRNPVPLGEPPAEPPPSPEPEPENNNPPITPAWSFEHWVWEDDINTQDSTEQLIADYTANGIPVGAVIVDSPWETNYNTFEFKTSDYPDAQGMIDDLASQGIQTVLWATGYVNLDSNHEGGKSSNYDHVLLNGYAVNNGVPNGWWKGTGIHIDFTNLDAVAWWHTQLDKALDLGIGGWKVDMSVETIPSDTVITSIGAISNDEFKSYYYGDFFDYTLSKNPNGIILARPYSWQTEFAAPISKLPIGWVGDNSGTWSGLRQQLGDIYTSAEAGYGAVGAEIGGYHDVEPTKKVLLRWAQMGALMPLMENGGTNGGVTAHLPWNHDQQTVDIYRYFATLHTELVPYMFSYGVEANQTGLSIIRDADSDNDQHLLGENILVSVITSESNQKQVVFPEGSEWIDFWDNSQRYDGGASVTYDVPIDRYPIFIKAGAIIPIRVKSELTGFGDATSDGKETILVFPSGQTSFVYHMPLGDGIEYSDVTILSDETNQIININGSTSTAYRLKVKWPTEPETVTGVDEWSYDDVTGFLTADVTGTNVTIMIDEVVDEEPPTLLSAFSAGQTQVNVRFSEMLDSASAENALNYAINGGIGVISASLQPDQVTVVLTTSAHAEGVQYTLTVSGVSDLALNPIVSHSDATYAFETILVISDLVVKGTPVTSILTDVMGVGARLYSDRPSFIVESHPNNLIGETIVQTANNDKGEIDPDPFMSFVVNQNVTVYIAYDPRASVLPAWLDDSWTAAGELTTTDSGEPNRDLFSKVFPTSIVELGANMAEPADGAQSNYSVIVASTTVESNIPPVASFIALGLPGEAPLTVAFDASESNDPDGAIASYSWDFGDGTILEDGGVSPSHEYNEGGTFKVTLTVTDDGGAMEVTSVDINIDAANITPTASFIALGLPTEAPLTVVFDASLSSDPDGVITSYSWDFGDGTFLEDGGVSLLHEFTEGGTFSVTLTVTDDDGATGISSLDINVEAPNISPVASFEADITSGEVPLTVAFDASASSDIDGVIASYSWDFGDGTVLEDSGVCLSHEFTNIATFEVTLTVIDDNGDSGATSLEVVVNAPVDPVYPTLPGQLSPSLDLDGDGKAEDFNANGRLDFDDIVQFFVYFDDPIVVGSPWAFDHNGNGLVDLDDVVFLFDMMLAQP